MAPEDAALLEAWMLEDAPDASSAFVTAPPPLAVHLEAMRDLAGNLSQRLEACLDGGGGGGGDALDLGELLGVVGPLIEKLRDALDGVETYRRACEGGRMLRLRPDGLDELGSRYAAGTLGRCYFENGLVGADSEVHHPLGPQVAAIQGLENGRDVLNIVPTGAGKTAVPVSFAAAHHAVEMLTVDSAASTTSRLLTCFGVVLSALVSTMLDQLGDLNGRFSGFSGHFAVALRTTGASASRSRRGTSYPCESLSLALTVDDDGEDCDDSCDDHTRWSDAKIIKSTTDGTLAPVLIYMTYERFALPHVHAFLYKMLQAGRVTVWVIDEVDYLLSCDESFRPDALEVGRGIDNLEAGARLRCATGGCSDFVRPPRLATSATVPVHLEDAVTRLVGLRSSEGGSVLVLRAPVDRANLELFYVKAGATAAARVEQLVFHVANCGRAGYPIVYVLGWRKAGQVWRALVEDFKGRRDSRPVLLVRSGLSDREKRSVLAQFRDAVEGAVLVMTNSGARGVHHPRSTDLILFSVPGSVADKVQIEGRTARGPGARGTVLQFYSRSVLFETYPVLRRSGVALAQFIRLMAVYESIVWCQRWMVAAEFGDVAAPRRAAARPGCCAACNRFFEDEDFRENVYDVDEAATKLLQLCAAEAPPTFHQLTGKDGRFVAWARDFGVAARERIVLTLLTGDVLSLPPQSPSERSGGVRVATNPHGVDARRRRLGEKWAHVAFLPAETADSSLSGAARIEDDDL